MSVDKILQEAFKNLDRIYFRDFKDVGVDEKEFDYYYAESTLYIIRNRKLKYYYFVTAPNPANALMQVKNEVI